ncbi:MAG: hypothetical protein ABF917_06875 [Gluconobacter oxydans]|uniref:hypothetical protein n=1 Tax=Gluconobacter oxydans TaxID=442 RepID=UPI0039EB3771
MTAPQLADFVLETATNPGTAAFTLNGAATDRRSFSAAFPNGGRVFYFADDGTQAEWGIGTLTVGTPSTLARTTVLGNSYGTAALLNFVATIEVYNEIPAAYLPVLDDDGSLKIQGGLAVGSGITAGGVAVPTKTDLSQYISGVWALDPNSTSGRRGYGLLYDTVKLQAFLFYGNDKGTNPPGQNIIGLTSIDWCRANVVNNGAASGLEPVNNLVRDLSDGSLMVNTPSLVALRFAQTSFGTLSGGYWIRVGNILFQQFTVSNINGNSGAIAFPKGFSGTPSVNLGTTNAGSNGDSVIANINRGSVSNSGLSVFVVWQAGGTSDVASDTDLTITAMGPA